MIQKTMRPVPALGSGSGLGDRFSSAAATTSETTIPTIAGQVTSLQVYRLRKRFGLTDSVARVISSHAYGLSLEGHRG